MILKRGITSFFDWDAGGAIPEFTFTEFKCVVFGATDSLGIAVPELHERGVTPNFHSARLVGTDTSLTVIGHSTYPIIAFSKPLKLHECKLHFVDYTRLALEIGRLFPDLTVATAEELNRKPSKGDIESLDSTELDQIEYWKPQTVGEIAFNWWD